MGLQFTDADGREGTVNDSLSVDYSGTWEVDVKEYVATVEKDESNPNQDINELDVMNHLVLELPVVAPTVAVERDIA